ncbi:MAG TPA: carbamoyltransferase C-terminal domain-containing protein [Thermoanaerobaculia bacterium]|nr:carbamoyltransferase C-terminal domain-containing protein [Thermoanaerobaculia bacterium]
MNILGINAFHGDSSAAALQDGAFVCGLEEERLNRIKHWAGFPEGAIRTVIEDARTALSEIEHVAISRNPSAHFVQKILFALRKMQSLDTVKSRMANIRKVADLGDRLRTIDAGFRGRIHHVEHHRAHIASAFFCSPFEEAACLSVDGFGDFCSSMSAIGRGSSLEILDHVVYPHSLGIFYTAITQFLGFPKYGDEYKVMGLASYGEPRFLPQMREIVILEDDGQFQTNLDFFVHAAEGVTMSWEGGEPVIGRLFSQKLVETLGTPREPGSEITQEHKDIAASLQAMYEEAFFHRLNWLHRRTGLKALCLAGGCAMNSVANGKIFRNTRFTDVYIQSAAGDAGTALGAALYVWHEELHNPRDFVMTHSYWGPRYDESAIVAALKERVPGFDPHGNGGGGLRVRREESSGALTADTAAAIARGEIIGWYQGRSEWGPRALGNRSILVDPRRAEMKDILNARVKRREPFRPFAPSILQERVGDYFEESYPDPFMIKVYPVRPAKRAEIPAVTHVDGTGRLQTVSSEQNPRYWELIKSFETITGVPILLNTSFNENEPIVNTPDEAIQCFLRTKMDRLVLGNWIVERSGLQ